MGQARSRGTFEQRKAEAVARNKVLAAERREREAQEAIERQRRRDERDARLPPEKRARRQRANVGSIGGLSMVSLYPYIVDALHELDTQPSEEG